MISSESASDTGNETVAASRYFSTTPLRNGSHRPATATNTRVAT